MLLRPPRILCLREKCVVSLESRSLALVVSLTMQNTSNLISDDLTSPFRVVERCFGNRRLANCCEPILEEPGPPCYCQRHSSDGLRLDQGLLRFVPSEEPPGQDPRWQHQDQRERRVRLRHGNLRSKTFIDLFKCLRSSLTLTSTTFPPSSPWEQPGMLSRPDIRTTM